MQALSRVAYDLDSEEQAYALEGKGPETVRKQVPFVVVLYVFNQVVLLCDCVKLLLILHRPVVHFPAKASIRYFQDLHHVALAHVRKAEGDEPNIILGQPARCDGLYVQHVYKKLV